jgi:DNA modification methylase
MSKPKNSKDRPAHEPSSPAALQALDLDLASLVPDRRNANKGTQKGRGLLAKSISDLGAGRSVVVDAKGQIVAGNKSVQAFVEAGMTDAIVVDSDGTRPIVVRRTDWDLDDRKGDARRYAYLDNRVAEIDLEWDGEVIADDLANGLVLDDVFGEAELRKLTGLGGPQDGDDDVPEPPANPTTKPGDTWVLGRHRVHCGDSTSPASYAAACGPHKPWIMVTDPPYGVEYDPTWRKGVHDDGSVGSSGKVKNDDRTGWMDAWRLFGGDVAYAWHAAMKQGPELASDLAACGFEIRAQIVWVKNRATISRGAYHWGHETCWYAVRKGKTARWSGDRKQSTVWEMQVPTAKSGIDEGDTKTNHSTQKPVEAMLRPLQNHGAPGDVVYDPFLGSGTTLIAAERSGRTCVGVELDPAYVDVIVARWEKATGLVAHREDGSGLVAPAAEVEGASESAAE